jgi:hypothetical protein
MSSPVRCAVSISERVLIALIVASVVAAQIKAPTDKRFEVVSVKPDSPGSNSRGCAFSTTTFSDPVQFTIGHCSLTTLINYAYGSFADDRIAGVPNWANSAWYSVSAKAASPVSIGEKYAMLQPVMEERFKLKWHREMRQLPVYYLSVNGAVKLQKTVPGSCRTWDPKVGPPHPDPKQPPVCGVWMNRYCRMADEPLRLTASRWLSWLRISEASSAGKAWTARVRRICSIYIWSSPTPHSGVRANPPVGRLPGFRRRREFLQDKPLRPPPSLRGFQASSPPSKRWDWRSRQGEGHWKCS